MRGIRLYAIVTAAFMAGAFLASPDLMADAANTIGSADIINESILSVDIKDAEVKTPDLASNAVTAAKIKDGEVKAAEIATDAVGASELQGVTKLLFGQCNANSSTIVSPGFVTPIPCNISGVDADDSAVATIYEGANCFSVMQAFTQSNSVSVWLMNHCTSTSQVGMAKIGVIVFDK